MGANPTLEAVTGDWLATDFAAWFRDHDPGAGHRQLTLDELVGGELAVLHERLVDAGSPAKAATKYLAGWFGGLTARSLGFAVLAAGAWFELEPDELRWYLHPGGWADRLELGTTRALVAPGHAWADAEVVPSERERNERLVAALARALEPLIDALQPFGSLGRPGLWAEVGDGLAGPLAFQSELPVTAAAIAQLERLVTAEAAPWTALPRLWAVDGVCVIVKGGCCRAYTAEGVYCTNCPLQDDATCERAQLDWAEH
jgi:hypothetical protein